MSVINITSVKFLMLTLCHDCDIVLMSGELSFSLHTTVETSLIHEKEPTIVLQGITVIYRYRQIEIDICKLK